ncbi:MAG: GIY-YIG nuclease family protein, partial [Thermoleophilia bacterium]|nr:GIY-YIG nuclease family protein [Thermoleophilia bacterium]
ACHRALADAQAAGHVFITLVGRLQERGITRLSELRAYTNPSSRSVVEKLGLTRDLPKAPGTYRFLDKDGQILYVGKADRLRERVRSHFVDNADNGRRVRQALRLVERIDWDETGTPLEAVVREQELILEHRPLCNMHGTRPETYCYVKVSSGGPGLNLSTTSRAPRWLASEAQPSPQSRRPIVMGPFRGRTRLNAALDLLQHCYPIRRCPRRPDERPCVRADHGRCLAPCSGDAQTRAKHDDLVMEILGWLSGRADVNLPEPLERADAVIRTLARQRRFEDAQNLREARDHLLHVRYSYDALVEARQLCFAALWAVMANGDGPAVRLNLVWNGKLQEPVSLQPSALEEGIEAALCSLWHTVPARTAETSPALVAVPQTELDSLLAVRRWFYEAGHTSLVTLPGPDADPARKDAVRNRLIDEARRLVSTAPSPAGEAQSPV